MKRLFIFITISLFSLAVFSQNDKQAKQILDKAYSVINSSNGIKLTFKGTNSGELLMKKNKFYLSSDEIQTWFDGKTMWSYVHGNDEVNVTSPSAEELQSINPYTLLATYRNGYNYKYAGQKTINGKKANEVILTPQKKNSISSIAVYITNDNQPLMIKIKERNNRESQFIVTSFNNRLNLNDSAFRFNKKKYPNAEVIDLR